MRSFVDVILKVLIVMSPADTMAFVWEMGVSSHSHVPQLHAVILENWNKSGDWQDSISLSWQDDEMLESLSKQLIFAGISLSLELDLYQ